MTDSTDVLLEAAQADDDEAEPGGGCLKRVLRLKGVGFVEFGEVERALRKVKCVWFLWGVGGLNQAVGVCVPPLTLPLTHPIFFRPIEQDHVSKETVEALFDAMGGLITDASFEVFQRRMGEIVGEDRAAVTERLVRMCVCVCGWWGGGGACWQCVIFWIDIVLRPSPEHAYHPTPTHPRHTTPPHHYRPPSP